MWLQRKSQPVLEMATRQMCEIAGQPYTFLWLRRAFEGLEPEQAKIERELEAFSGWVREQGGDFAVVFVPAHPSFCRAIHCSSNPPSERSA